MPDVQSVTVEHREVGDSFADVRGSYGYLWSEMLRVSVPAVLAIGAYAGKKAVDVIADIVKAEITNTVQEAHRAMVKVEIYGPDGAVITRIDKSTSDRHPPSSPKTAT